MTFRGQYEYLQRQQEKKPASQQILKVLWFLPPILVLSNVGAHFRIVFDDGDNCVVDIRCGF